MCRFTARRTAKATTANKTPARNATEKGTNHFRSEARWQAVKATMPPDKPPIKPPIRPTRIFLICFRCICAFKNRIHSMLPDYYLPPITGNKRPRSSGPILCGSQCARPNTYNCAHYRVADSEVKCYTSLEDKPDCIVSDQHQRVPIHP